MSANLYLEKLAPEVPLFSSLGKCKCGKECCEPDSNKPPSDNEEDDNVDEPKDPVKDDLNTNKPGNEDSDNDDSEESFSDEEEDPPPVGPATDDNSLPDYDIWEPTVVDKPKDSEEQAGIHKDVDDPDESVDDPPATED